MSNVICCRHKRRSKLIYIGIYFETRYGTLYSCDSLSLQHLQRALFEVQSYSLEVTVMIKERTAYTESLTFTFLTHMILCYDFTSCVNKI